MSLPSLVPEVSIDVATLPLLLPWWLRYNVLYPHSDLFSHVVETQMGSPPWNAELEAYYRTFHPWVWLKLALDNNGDAYALKQLRSRLSKLQSAGLNQERDDGASVGELQSAITFILSRQRDRWNRRYGLLDIRDKYLELYKNICPWKVDDEIMDETLEAMDFTAPTAAHYSLWPFLLPPPEAGLVCRRDKDVD